MTRKTIVATVCALIVFALTLSIVAMLIAGRRGGGSLTFGDLVYGAGAASVTAFMTFRFFAKRE
jgi:hypothetical protein